MDKEMIGVATALYGDEEEVTLSIARLKTQSAESIKLADHRNIVFDPSSKEATREAFSQLFEYYCLDRVQLMHHCRGQLAQLPLQIVHGIPETSNPEFFGNILQNAFPEFLAIDRSCPDLIEVNRIFDEIIQSAFQDFFRSHPSSAREDGLTPIIESHPSVLFGAECPGTKCRSTITESEEEISRLLEKIITRAEEGDRDALMELRKNNTSGG